MKRVALQIVPISLAFLALSVGVTRQAVAGSASTPNEAEISQTGVATAEGGSLLQLKEVIVTARKRAEDLQKVPMSVTALDANSLTAMAVQTESDLQEAVPGLTVAQTTGENNFNYSMRGQNVDTYSSSPPAIVTYYDEVAVSPHAESSVFDIKNVQVLKGPQGTLFGQNTTGGAVLFQTAQPTDTFEGYLQAQGGSYDSAEAQGALNIPVGSRAALRVAGNYDSGGQFVHNVYTNDWWGGKEDRAGRATLLLKPIDGLMNTTMVQYERSWGMTVPNVLYSVNACGTPGLNTVADCGTGGAVGAYLNSQRSHGFYTSDLNTREPFKAYSNLYINTTKYDLGESSSLENIASYSRTYGNAAIDYDASPFSVYNNTPAGETLVSSQGSDELRIEGSAIDRALQYTTGLYYSQDRDLTDAPLAIFSVIPSHYHFQAIQRSSAVYTQETYRFSRKWSVTGGVRYTWIKTNAHQLAGSVWGNGNFEETSANAPSWNVSLSYQATPSLLLYGVTRGSYRMGGFNFTAPPVPTTAASNGNLFEPEYARDVEVGVKFAGYAGGVPFQASADIYNAWIKQQQRVVYVNYQGAPEALTVNLAQAQVSGFEANFLARPFIWLEAGGSLTYTDGRYVQPSIVVFFQQTDFGPYANTPPWSGSVYFEISHTLPGSDGALKLRVDGYSQSAWYFSSLNATTIPGTRIGPYTTANLRATWSGMFGTGLTSSLEVKNMLGRKYYGGGLATGAAFGVNSVVPAPPRMIFGELRYDF